MSFGTVSHSTETNMKPILKGIFYVKFLSQETEFQGSN